MCLITFAWRPGHTLPLIVAANRDEYHDRPTSALAAWHDAPGIYAGRDLKAGGTWMGIERSGRFAALTNIVDPRKPVGARSRGELVAGFLQSQLSVENYLHQLVDRVGYYSGFNLLVGDRKQLGYLNAEEAKPRLLTAGVYGLSNAKLDTPWPKVVKASNGLRRLLETPDHEQLLSVLADREQAADDQLPDTGVGKTMEKLMSSIFITNNEYGTRASTVLIVDSQGRRRMAERTFGPCGKEIGEVCLKI